MEGSGGGGGSSGGLPCFTQLVLSRLWEAGEVCPHAALEWLAMQVPRNKAAHAWALRTADRWVEAQLLAAGAARVRAAAALLLVALVPSQHFRAGYARRPPSAPTPAPTPTPAPAATASQPLHLAKLPDTAHHTLHQVYYRFILRYFYFRYLLIQLAIYCFFFIFLGIYDVVGKIESCSKVHRHRGPRHHETDGLLWRHVILCGQ